MRHDVVTGFAVSAIIHVGLLFGGNLLPHRAPAKKPAEKPPVVQVIEMPRIEPEDPEPVDTTSDDTKPIDVAAPMQPDLPQVRPDTQFVQQIEPPPPENLKPSTGLFTIPGDRGRSQLQHLQVFNPDSLDQQPIARVRTPPQYPFEMKRSGTTGEVLVDFIVDDRGEVRNAYVIRGTNREFEQAAVQAVSRWKFKPGRKNGRYVNTHMQVPIVFSLNDE
jgi:protein TonB